MSRFVHNEVQRPIVGDLPTRTYYENKGRELLTRTNKPQYSDANLEAAKQFEGFKQAEEYNRQGYLADKQAIDRTRGEQYQDIQTNLRKAMDTANANVQLANIEGEKNWQVNEAVKQGKIQAKAAYLGNMAQDADTRRKERNQAWYEDYKTQLATYQQQALDQKDKDWTDTTTGDKGLSETIEINNKSIEVQQAILSDTNSTREKIEAAEKEIEKLQKRNAQLEGIKRQQILEVAGNVSTSNRNWLSAMNKYSSILGGLSIFFKDGGTIPKVASGSKMTFAEKLALQKHREKHVDRRAFYKEINTGYRAAMRESTTRARNSNRVANDIFNRISKASQRMISQAISRPKTS